MLERAFKGTPTYWLWLGFLVSIICMGFIAYVDQAQTGLTITGMSRDVSWGFYIAQFTYLVGLAASGVMIVLPYYFHNYKKFKHLVIFGEFMAIAAVVMCMLFIVVDLGQPTRAMNVAPHPTPNSVMFWDMTVLVGYLILNLVCGWVSLECDRQSMPHPKWLRPVVYLSVVWAFSIHTVTAFLIQGLPGRHYWLTAIMAGRFLASAFCAGPAILLLVIMAMGKLTTFCPGRTAIKTLAKIITYAMCVNVFFFLLELFTAMYSGIPGHAHPIMYLFVGEHGHTEMVTWMWFAVFCAITCLALLIPHKLRNNLNLLPISLILLITSTWIDKGFGLLVGGFNPTPFETITPYMPTGQELMVAGGVYAIGALVVTILFKVAVDVKAEVGASQKTACGCDPEDCQCSE